MCMESQSHDRHGYRDGDGADKGWQLRNSEAEILNIFKNFPGTLKEWNSGPLSYKFAKGCQAIKDRDVLHNAYNRGIYHL